MDMHDKTDLKYCCEITLSSSCPDTGLEFLSTVSVVKAHTILLSYATFVVINSLGTIASEVVNSKITLGRCLNFASEISKEKHIFKIKRARVFFLLLFVKFA